MEKVYTVCMIIGIAIPLITVLLGELGDMLDNVFDGIFGAIDFDFNIHVGDFCLCLLPLSMQSICIGLLLFGVVGKLSYPSIPLIAANCLAGAIGYVCAILIQSLIKKLKKVEHTTYAKEDLLLFDAKVINRIPAGGFGSVSVKTSDGIASTYPAKAENKEEIIKQNAIVHITHFEKNIAIVQLKDSTKGHSSDISELTKKYEDSCGR